MYAYIHIPFCNSICNYCDFTKFCYNKKWIMPYLESLKKEIIKDYKGEKLKTIYIGGGTPSSLDINELKYLFDIIKIFNKEDKIEFTIEANLNDLTKEKIELFKQNNVNRISIGIQTFNPKLQKILNRTATYQEALNKINLLKEYGINNINVDLMYGINGETKEILEDDLNKFLSLNVTHISTYSLILEEHTKLYIDGYKEINEELDASFYEIICNTLKDKYVHYEVSNFAIKGYESKHNLNYWNNGFYYGFGLSAASYIENRYENHKNLFKYLNSDFTKEEEVISLDRKMEYEMILGLRKLEGININDFKKKYHKDIEEVFDIENLIKNNLLIKNDNFLKINADKIYLSNEILINFIK